VNTLISDDVRATLQASEAEAAQLYATFTKLREEVIESGVNPLGQSTDEKGAFDKLDAASQAYDAKAQEVAELQQSLARMAEIDALADGGKRPASASRLPYSGRDQGRQPARSIGDRLIQSPEYQALAKNGAFLTDGAFASMVGRGLERPVALLERDELEALLRFADPLATTVTGGSATSAGPFIQNDLIPGFINYRRKRPMLSAMVGRGSTDSDTVEYVNQTAPTDAAAETAEDTAAPESTYAFETLTTAVREITHWVPVTLRAMADHGQLRTIVDNQLVAGALDRLDTQIASGAGSGVTLLGIYNASGIGAQSAAGLSKSAAIHKAMTKVRVAAGVLGEPDAIGIHPNDFEKLLIEEDAQGRFLFGDPRGGEERTIWGKPMIISTVFPEATPLVGDFEGSATLWLRESLSVTTGLDGNDFTKRRVSMLAAIRAAFAVTRAGGFCALSAF